MVRTHPFLVAWLVVMVAIFAVLWFAGVPL